MSVVQTSDVKKLREATSAGFLDCKRALEISEGDYDRAYMYIREQGKVKADKKSDRVAANGVVVAQHNSEGSAMVEINCETDFVARNEIFQKFAEKLLSLVTENKISDVAVLNELKFDDTSVEQARLDLVISMGENIKIRRCTYLAAEGMVAVSYQHGQRIGVLVRMNGADETFAEEIAMQVAASNPMALHPTDIPADILAQERSIAVARVSQMGKPENIAASIVEGMVAKFVDANTLGGQEFIMDTKLKVEEVLRQKKSTVEQFIRFELGEGIEVVQENFADAVRAMQNQA